MRTINNIRLGHLTILILWVIWTIDKSFEIFMLGFGLLVIFNIFTIILMPSWIFLEGGYFNKQKW